MNDDALPHSEIILYQTEDGRTRVQCRFENESIWLTQAQIAELFETTPQNITLHLKAIFAEGELVEAATCKDYLQVRSEGGREVSRKLWHYRLDAILAVGFRVRSHRGTQFSEHELLNHAGKISAEQAKMKAEVEYERYRVFLDSQPRLVDLDFEKVASELKKRPKPKKPKPPKKCGHSRGGAGSD